MTTNSNLQTMIETIKRHDQYVRLENPQAVVSSEVLRVMQQVDRKLFVPEKQKQKAYLDQPLHIGDGQTISQPYIVALMTSLLNIDNHSAILEVGTGSGYQAAILSQIARIVYSLEVVETLSKKAQDAFASLHIDNIHCLQRNGFLGLAECAPFDGIIVTAVANKMPEVLIEQLKVGANMAIPLEDASSNQMLYKITKTSKNSIQQAAVIPVRFVPMVG